MNLPQLADDLAARIPDMAKDSPLNNADIIQRLLKEVWEAGWDAGEFSTYTSPLDHSLAIPIEPPNHHDR